MAKTGIIEPTADEAVRMYADIQNSLAEIERLRERMQHDQNDIEKSQVRTRAMLARLRTE